MHAATRGLAASANLRCKCGHCISRCRPRFVTYNSRNICQPRHLNSVWYLQTRGVRDDGRLSEFRSTDQLTQNPESFRSRSFRFSACGESVCDTRSLPAIFLLFFKAKDDLTLRRVPALGRGTDKGVALRPQRIDRPFHLVPRHLRVAHPTQVGGRVVRNLEVDRSKRLRSAGTASFLVRWTGVGTRAIAE